MDEKTEAVVKYLQGEGTQKEWGEKLGVSASTFGKIIGVKLRKTLSEYGYYNGKHGPLEGYLIEGLENAGRISTATEAKPYVDIITPLLQGEEPPRSRSQFRYVSYKALPVGVELQTPIVLAEEGEWPTATRYKGQLEQMNEMGRQGYRFVHSEPTDEEAFEWVPIEGQDDKVRKEWYSLVRCYFEREMF